MTGHGEPKPVSVLLLGGSHHGQRKTVAPGAPRVHLYRESAHHAPEHGPDPLDTPTSRGLVEEYVLGVVSVGGVRVPIYVHESRRDAVNELLRAYLGPRS